MSKEKRKCQNCNREFAIEPEDLAFYDKIKVPPPTWCPECRMVRRLQFRNERTLYRFTCELCGEPGISMYPDTAPFPVYCANCWYSDKWDQLSYARDYDFSRPFFEQWKDLFFKVPKASIFHRNVENAKYSNIVGESKNLYLSYSSTKNSENVYYSKNIDHSTDVFDCLNIVDVSRCYGIVDGTKNYNSKFLVSSQNCMDSSFLYDCANCRNCFLSAGLRNKEYVIRNKQYAKEEYAEEIKKFDTGSFSAVDALKKEFASMMEKTPRRYAVVLKSVDATGDNIVNSKNVKDSFDVYDMEDTRYVFRSFGTKGVYDANNIGNSELIYDFAGGGGMNSSGLMFSSNGIRDLRDIQYTDYCTTSSHLFGCASMRDKQYCILNKQYSKEEYEALVPKIKEHMNDMPYVDARGRMYQYGEFFPPEMSSFAYNETIAQEYFPLSKEEVLERGYRWKDPEEKNYRITKKTSDLPDHIKDVDDSILEETVECAHGGRCTDQCTSAFRIVREELVLYRKFDLPLPRLCPNCRHYERLRKKNPMKLWHRRCMCDKPNHGHAGKCPNEFETSYAPERPELVYCESCYNAEVV